MYMPMYTYTYIVCHLVCCVVGQGMFFHYHLHPAFVDSSIQYFRTALAFRHPDGLLMPTEDALAFFRSAIQHLEP